MRIDLGEDEAPEIGLIALIDCIFFLLMFFMVATSFKMNEGEKKDKFQTIVLPTSQLSLDRSTAAPDPFVIGVDKSGGLYVGADAQQAVSLGTLRDRLQQVAKDNPARVVRIEGDRSTAFQAIVQVLDLCQLEGLVNVSVRTR